MIVHRRILTAIDLTRRGEAVARHAARLARSEGARLIVAHVMDYSPGFESDHVPFITPDEMKAALVKAAEIMMTRLVRRLDAGENVCQVVVAGRREPSIAGLAARWRPDMIVVGEDATHGLEAGGAGCEVLIVPTGRSAFFPWNRPAWA